MEASYIAEVFRLTRAISPISLTLKQLRTYSRLRRVRTGKMEVDGSDPPFLLPGAGTAVLRNLRLRNTDWGVAPVASIPVGKA